MDATFDISNDCLLQQMSNELKGANTIIQTVFKKYKLKYGDITLSPLKDSVSLAINVHNLLDNQDTPTMSSLLKVDHHTKKSA
jgi:hypothetical protein